jgi:hypothetical protein
MANSPSRSTFPFNILVNWLCRASQGSLQVFCRNLGYFSAFVETYDFVGLLIPPHFASNFILGFGFSKQRESERERGIDEHREEAARRKAARRRSRSSSSPGAAAGGARSSGEEGGCGQQRAARARRVSFDGGDRGRGGRETGSPEPSAGGREKRRASGTRSSGVGKGPEGAQKGFDRERGDRDGGADSDSSPSSSGSCWVYHELSFGGAFHPRNGVPS